MNPICNDDSLINLLQADDGSMREVAEHVVKCSYCKSRIESLAADVGEWQLARRVLASPPSHDIPSNGVSKEDYRQEWIARRERSTIWTDSMAKSLLSPPSHPEMMGRIGRYDVARLIGSGGMGVVFKAWDTELNRPVAVKLLAPFLASSGSARNRFAREARAAAAVVDDHVVPIHNVESGDDPEQPPFLVMKYIAGGSLQERLDHDGPLKVCEILRIGMQIANGLSAAHAQGLIHRDVKPSNILLDEGVDRALITDFGLAHAEDDACLTRSGFQPGTPHYMSPEQVRGEAIDGRSDLFGLGCVLYALCTGHPPFRADTSYAVLRRITDNTARPIREINPFVPDWLAAITTKLLAKSPEDRFESADAVAELLEACLAHFQQPTQAALPKEAEQLQRVIATTQGGGAGKKTWTRMLVLACAPLLPIFAAIVFLETGKGTIRIETNSDAAVPIVILQGNDVVDELTVSQTGSSVRLHAGNYVIETKGERTGVTIQGDQVQLTRGGEWLVKVKLQEKAPRPVRNGDGTASIESQLNSDQVAMRQLQNIEETNRIHRSLANRTRAYTGSAMVRALVNELAPPVERPSNSAEVLREVNRVVREQQAISEANVEFHVSELSESGVVTRKFRVFLDGENQHFDAEFVPENGPYSDAKSFSAIPLKNKIAAPNLRKLGLVNWWPDSGLESFHSQPADIHLAPTDDQDMKVTLERRNGTEVAIVNVSSGRGPLSATTQYWLSPSVGNRPVFIKRFSPPTSHVAALTIEQRTTWRKYDGVWFPATIKTDFRYGDSKSKTFFFETISAKFKNVVLPDGMNRDEDPVQTEAALEAAISFQFGARLKPAPPKTLVGCAWQRGLEITHLMENGPAKEAGLVVGDILVLMGKQPVGSLREIDRIWRETDYGEPVEIKFLRYERESVAQLRWNFRVLRSSITGVVLVRKGDKIEVSVGTGDGVYPGDQLTTVTRNGKFVGRARIVIASENRSTARVIHEHRQTPIQAGNHVSFGPSNTDDPKPLTEKKPKD